MNAATCLLTFRDDSKSYLEAADTINKVMKERRESIKRIEK